jgi:hypothetical protein
MSPDFWEKLILQLAGPLFTTVVGTLIIGTFGAWITRKAQDRRADDQRREEHTRAEHELRIRLIGQMTEAGSNLYMATQDFWRKKEIENAPAEELDQHRKDLDMQYCASRVQGEVIERQLEVYFTSNEPKKYWHATMDLLTIRYFKLIGLMTDRLLEANAGEEHTGLSIEQLRDQGLVLATYRKKLNACMQAVLEAPMRQMAG